MTKQNIITWVSLMILTIVVGLLSNATIPYLVPIILIITLIKFIAVAFSFMEMSKAHILWKLLILGFLGIYFGILLLAL